MLASNRQIGGVVAESLRDRSIPAPGVPTGRPRSAPRSRPDRGIARPAALTPPARVTPQLAVSYLALTLSAAAFGFWLGGGGAPTVGIVGVPAEIEARILDLERGLDETSTLVGDELATARLRYEQLIERIEDREAASPGPSGPRTAQVSASSLWVRAGPGTGFKPLERLERGTRVTVSGSPRNGWARVSAPREGWVAAQHLTP